MATGAAYTNTLTPDEGYSFTEISESGKLLCRVNMGGNNVSSSAFDASTGVVSIARVTGDISIEVTSMTPIEG